MNVMYSKDLALRPRAPSASAKRHGWQVLQRCALPASTLTRDSRCDQNAHGLQ